MTARTNLRSSRSLLAPSSVPLKRKTRAAVGSVSPDSDESTVAENGHSNGPSAKRVKPEVQDAPENDMESEIVDVMTDFNICVNELFQLKEYGSLVEWNPLDFSKTLNPLPPEIFEYFLNNNNYHLIWDEALLENMDAIPLRLQKKKIQEREARLREKYPFKDSVLQRAMEKEKALFAIDKKPHGKTASSPPPKTVKKEKARLKGSKVKMETSPSLSPESELEDVPEEPEFDFDFNEEDLNTNYKLKQISFSIPHQKVTHPSHIPSWRPPTAKESEIAGQRDEVTFPQFDPQPLKVVVGKDESFHVPSIEQRLNDFLTSKFKAPIVDDSNNDFNNTPDEFNLVLDQQIHLLKRLYDKIVVEERFEVNGDKIERRKVIAPNLSNQRASDPFRDTGAIAPKIQGASNDLTYQDFLLAQGMAFSKIHQLMRRQHQARTRKIAQMVEQHFRKKRGEKERLQREQDQNLRRISRLAIQAVKKRWSQAYKVYRHIQMEKEEQIKQIEGREHLSKMLEHSTQLLEAQLQSESKTDVEADSADSDDDDDNDDDNNDDNNDEEEVSGNDHNSDNFSSDSESDEELDTNLNDKADSECTVEELRKKYANLESSVEPSLEKSDVDDDDDDEEPAGLAALYGKEFKPEVLPDVGELVDEYTEEQKRLIESYENTPEAEMLNSDQSDLMTEESSTEEESEEEEEEEVETDDGKKLALTSLYDEQDMGESSGSTVDEEEPKTPSNEEKDEKVEEINGLKVKDVPVPSLLKGELRPYQKQGLNWLASLYNNNTNGILADEMGLGKTIQTIALLSYLACEHHIWGPHLIVVPTSVMLNWEMEFKKFAPGFKVLTYYGSPQERARKRKGWNKMDAFHVCITSYQLVVHDHSSFKRRRWRYMILDEAHNIKNFRSTRWKALLNFNTENRLLLTGTPLQNNLMELWSLLYFLMPSSKVDQMMPDGFANFEDFQQWFGKPVDKILEKTSTGELIDENVTNRLDEETKNTVSRLHQVLRPYLLRRLKKDVEQQMPGKYEHIVYCRLSKRQRYLYDDFMSRAKTKETLASGNFLSIINCLMQLRKVCNHPDLFEVRPIVTSYAVPKTVASRYRADDDTLRKLLRSSNDEDAVSLSVLNLDLTNADDMNIFAAQSRNRLKSTAIIHQDSQVLSDVIKKGQDAAKKASSDVVDFNRHLKLEEQIEHKARLDHILYLNELRCLRAPMYGASTLDFIKSASRKTHTETLQSMMLDIPQRASMMEDTLEKYAVITPKVVGIDMKDQLIPLSTQYRVREEVENKQITNPFHQSQVKLSIAFPDKQLLQYDCGKLQKLATLLHDLVPKGHRALIFTQMTKVLDILEQFLNIHGYRYLRLDGATKIEDRQLLTEKFNRDPRISVFILSTRSGGLGINLTGADTVIFYDSDWNPAMDKQCQDRCHRIGQLRDVHIYRFVSEYTIESNILKKANQKRQLDNVVIQEGDFTTDYMGKFSVRDLVSDANIISDLPDKPLSEGNNVDLLAQAEDEADRNAAKEAMKEVAVDDEDFDENKKDDSAKRSANDNPDDMDFDDGVGHIDEYMLRYIAEGFYAE